MKTELVHDHGHYFAKIDGSLYLIDTGSQFSIGTNEITISQKSYQLHEGMFTMESVNGHGLFDCHASGLIGLDILSCHELVIDLEHNCILWDEDMSSRFSSVVPMKNYGMYVTIPVSIDGRSCNAVVDTGAWTSYVKSQLLAGKDSVGAIHASAYPVVLSVAGESHETQVAEMPQLLSSLGFDAVLGLNQIHSSAFLLDITKGIFCYE